MQNRKTDMTFQQFLDKAARMHRQRPNQTLHSIYMELLGRGAPLGSRNWNTADLLAWAAREIDWEVNFTLYI